MKFDIKKIVLILAIVFRFVQFYRIVSNNSLLCYIFVIVITLLSIIEILKMKFIRPLFIKTIIILGISLLIFLFDTDDNLFIYSLIALLYIDEKDPKNFFKPFFYTFLVMYVTTIIFNQIGLVASRDAMRDSSFDALQRFSLGFGHVNSVFLYYLPILLSSYFLFDKKKITIFGIISAIILFIFSNSRAGFIFSLLFILIINLPIKKINNFFKNNAKKLFIIFTISSIVLAIIFGMNKSNLINQMLSNRLSNIYYYITHPEYYSLIGAGVSKNYTLDNFYINIFVNYGLVGYLFYLYILRKGISLFKDYKLSLVATLYLAYYLLEASTFGNFTVILAIRELLKDGSLDNDED